MNAIAISLVVFSVRCFFSLHPRFLMQTMMQMSVVVVYAQKKTPHQTNLLRDIRFRVVFFFSQRSLFGVAIWFVDISQYDSSGWWENIPSCVVWQEKQVGNKSTAIDCSWQVYATKLSDKTCTNANRSECCAHLHIPLSKQSLPFRLSLSLSLSVSRGSLLRCCSRRTIYLARSGEEVINVACCGLWKSITIKYALKLDREYPQ